MGVEGIIVIILVLFIIGYVAAYIMKTRHYRVIDAMEEKKKELGQRSLNEQFQQGDRLTLSGKSEEEFKKLLHRWNRVETQEMPSIENHLFEAEKSVDLLRFSKAKKAEETAHETISSVTGNIEQIQKELEQLLRRPMENQTLAEQTQQRYQQLRKRLLTQSFTFGPALEELENRLSEMEEQSSVFSAYTSEGDHMAGRQVLDQLDKDIEKMEHQLDVIPEELEVLDKVFPEDLKELRKGYEMLRKQDMKFPDDTILEDIQQLEEQLTVSKQLIGRLALEEAASNNDAIDDRIGDLYEKMEKEVQAKETVRKEAMNLRKAFHYLAERNRRLRIETDRIGQNYVLSEELASAGERSKEKLEKNQQEFELIQENLSDFPMIFSEVQQRLEDIFEQLEQINDDQEQTYEDLQHLRQEEQEIKQHVDEMELRMRAVKRKIEMHHLPGLPEQYLDLFFYVTDRIEELAIELSQLQMDIQKARELERLCEEEVQKIEAETDQLIDTVRLTELTMPYINRHRSESENVEEAIQQSRYYFREEFDYDAALNVLVQELERIEPGAFEEIKANYQQYNEGM